MKTLLFAPMWLDEENRLERNIKWLNYYTPTILNKLGVDQLLLVDNASKEENIQEIKKHAQIKTIIHRCDEFLPRTSHLEYPYWYRAFRIASKYAEDNDFDKIIHIDTDVFLLNTKICEYIKSIDSGWNTFWCKRHNFPESTLQVIGPDKLLEMEEWMTTGYLAHYPCDAELVIPFTNVNKDFTGDRYGEVGHQQTPEMDYYCQCPNEIKLLFELS